MLYLVEFRNPDKGSIQLERTIERLMFRVNIRHHIHNEVLRRPNIEDVISRIAVSEWSWVGHVTR